MLTQKTHWRNLDSNSSSDSELWADVPGWPGYEISATGRVRSWKLRGRAATNGKTRSVPVARKLSMTHDGYLWICLKDNDRKQNYTIHRLVLMAFSGPPLPGMQARHLDGNPLNNDLSNLVWGTALENHADRRRHGNTPQGGANQFARLSASDVLAIRAAAEQGTPRRSIQEHYGLSKSCIGHIIRRHTWRHI